MGTGSGDQDVRVSLGADHGEFDAGLRDSVSALRSSVDAMTASIGNLARSSADASRRTQEQNRATEFSFVRLHESIKSGFTSSMTVLETWKNRIGQIGAIFAGGALFKGAVDSVTHLADEVVKLENVFAMQSDQATTYATALKMMGKSADDFIGMSMKLGRQLKANEGDLNSLGIVTRDQNSHLLALDVIMQNAFATMQQYKAGADQDLFALKTFGRGAQEVYDYVTKLNTSIDRAAKLNAELGIEMGPAKQAQIRAYKQELAATKIVFEAMAEQIGEVLLPRLQAKAQWFSEHGPAAIRVFDFALKGIMSALEVFGTGAAVVAIEVASFFDNMATRVTGSWQIIKAAATGAWASIPGIVATANAKIVANNRAAFDSIFDAGMKMRKNLDSIWSERKIPAAAGPGPMKSGARTMPFEDKDAATRLDLWRQELDALKDAEDTFHEFSKAQEAQFWADKLTLTRKGSKDYVAVFHLMVEAKKAAQREDFANLMEDYNEQITANKNNAVAQIAIAHQRTETIKTLFGEESKEYKRALNDEIKVRQDWAAKELQILAIHAKMAEASAEHEVKMEQLALDQQVALHRVSSEQKFALEEQFESRLYQLKLREMQSLLAAEKNGPNDPVRVAQIEAQIEGLEQTHQEKLTQIHNAAVLEREKFALQADDAIKSSLGDLIASLTDRTKTLSEKLKSFVDSLTQQLSRIAANKLVEDLLGAGTQGGGVISDITRRIFGGGPLGAASGNPALTTAGTTLTSAGGLLQSAAAALTSAAGALTAGGFGGSLGGAFGGGINSMFGGGMGDAFSMVGLPFFDDGTNYVPKDTLAFIHKGEAVVPARYNTGQSSSNQRTLHMRVTNNFNGPIDSRTQNQIAAANYRASKRAHKYL